MVDFRTVMRRADTPRAYSVIVYRENDDAVAADRMGSEINRVDALSGEIFQSAIDAVPDEGGKLYIASGRYTTGNGLYWRSPIKEGPAWTTNFPALYEFHDTNQLTIEGAGRFDTLIDLKDASPGAGSVTKPGFDGPNGMIFIDHPSTDPDECPGSRVEISNMGLNGRRTHQTSDVAGIVGRFLMTSWIHDMWIHNVSRSGILSTGYGSSVGIANIGEEQETDHGSGNNVIENNQIFHVWFHGAAPARPAGGLAYTLQGIMNMDTDNVIRNNIVGFVGYDKDNTKHPGGAGICLYYLSTCMVHDNWIWGTAPGIMLNYANFNGVYNNLIENCQGGVVITPGMDNNIDANTIRLYRWPDDVANDIVGVNICDWGAGYHSYNNTVSNNVIGMCNVLAATYGIKTAGSHDRFYDNNVVTDPTHSSFGGTITIPYTIATTTGGGAISSINFVTEAHDRGNSVRVYNAPGMAWVMWDNATKRAVDFDKLANARFARIVIGGYGDEAGNGKGIRVYNTSNATEICKVEWNGNAWLWSLAGPWTAIDQSGDGHIWLEVKASSATENMGLWSANLQLLHM